VGGRAADCGFRRADLGTDARFGAHERFDWLHKPLDGKELLNAVTFHDTGNQGTKSRIITFISASGGAGATTLALSAAEHLASKSAERAASTCWSISISRAPIAAPISISSTSST